MSEEDAVGRVETPATVASLPEDLRGLGLVPGATLMVHSSLSRLGYVPGGTLAVVEALLAAVGTNGARLMRPRDVVDCAVDWMADHRAWNRQPHDRIQSDT